MGDLPREDKVQKGPWKLSCAVSTSNLHTFYSTSLVVGCNLSWTNKPPEMSCPGLHLVVGPCLVIFGTVFGYDDDGGKGPTQATKMLLKYDHIRRSTFFFLT